MARLDSEEGEDRDQHDVADLVDEVAQGRRTRRRTVVGEDVRVEVEEQHHDEEDDRHQLDDRHDPVDDRGVADAVCDQEWKSPTPTVETATASTVAPSPNPGKTAPTVDMMNTQYEVLPATSSPRIRTRS